MSTFIFGVFLGVVLGFGLCCVLIAGRNAD